MIMNRYLWIAVLLVGAVGCSKQPQESQPTNESCPAHHPASAISKLLGCHDLDQLHLGMSREDVEAVLGAPETVREWPTITVAATYTYRLQDPEVDVDLVFIEGLREIRLWQTVGEGEDQRRLMIEYVQPHGPLEYISPNETDRVTDLDMVP
jgi:hypothetical protein